jgi:hypothetical protein
MMKEMLESMKTTLLATAQAQMAHLDKVDAKELGEVIDMIKDIEEAMYYCTITEAMHQNYPEKNHYSEPMYYGGERMYYDGGRTHVSGTTGGMHPNGGHDTRSSEGSYEGTSHAQRRMYMESKQMHMGKAKQLQELEKYMKDLSTDLVDMIEDASVEEKQYLGNRLSALATKISKLEG